MTVLPPFAVVLSLWYTGLHRAPCLLSAHLSRSSFHKDEAFPLPQGAASPQKLTNSKKDTKKTMKWCLSISFVHLFVPNACRLRYLQSSQVSRICLCKGVWVPEPQFSPCNSVTTNWMRVPGVNFQCGLLQQRNFVFLCSFDGLLVPEVFLQGLGGVPRRPSLFPSSALVRQLFSQPYGFRDRGQKWELLILFPWESREEGASRALSCHWALSPLCSSPVSCSSIFSVPVSWHGC